MHTKLEGYVDLRAAYPVMMQAMRHLRSGDRQAFRVDCSQVADFSGQALAELARLSRQAREQGSSLVLASCADAVRQRMVSPVFEELVG